MDIKLISLLKRKVELPVQTRTEIDVLVEEFLNKIEKNIHDLICGSNNRDLQVRGQYNGLDSDHDTEDEVETAIRFFPNVLSRKRTIWQYWERVGEWKEYEGAGDYPIQLATYDEHTNYCCNLKAVSFVSLLARLAIELDQFREEERGGLLIKSGVAQNALELLVLSSNEDYGEEHHRLADNKFLTEIIRLRQMGLFKKEDIQRYWLVDKLCQKLCSLFAENRFRYLVEWDPTTLLVPGDSMRLPLHGVSYQYSIQDFQFEFELGIRYFPKKKGIHLLFKKDDEDYEWTPFQFACDTFGYKNVMRVIKQTLNNSDIPVNTADALITAATDETIDLDCVNFLLRREPDVLQKLLVSSPPPNYKSKLRKRKRGS